MKDNLNEVKLKVVAEVLSDLERFHSFHAKRINGRRFEDAEKAASKQWIVFELRLMESLHDLTQNPMFALRGLKVCLDGKIELPGWVEKYLQQSITGLLRAAYDEREGRPEMILKDCFDFRISKGSGGHSNPVSNYRNILSRFEKLCVYLGHRIESGLSWEELDNSLEGSNSGPLNTGAATIKKWRQAAIKILKYLPHNLI